MKKNKTLKTNIEIDFNPVAVVERSRNAAPQKLSLKELSIKLKDEAYYQKIKAGTRDTI